MSDNITVRLQAHSGTLLADVQRAVVLAVVDHCAGNKTTAAGILGVSVKTVRRIVNQLEESVPDRNAEAE